MASAPFADTNLGASGHGEGHEESKKFSCCAPPCIACWICVLFWPILIAVLLIIGAVVAVPPLAQETLDGSRIHLIEASAIATDRPVGKDGIQEMDLTSIMRMVNPVPIGTQLPGGDLTFSVNERFSWFNPGPVATSFMPKMYAEPGSLTFTYSTKQYMNISNPMVQLFAIGMVASYVFPNCPGCADTDKMRPVPMSLASGFTVKVFGVVPVKVNLDKELICHCIEDYPGSTMCYPLVYRTPYSNVYTPCPIANQTKCQPGAELKKRVSATAGAGLSLLGFHCMPIDEVVF